MAATQLVFTEVEGQYVAEATAYGDYNLHIEREVNGALEVAQTTVQDSEYVPKVGVSYTPLSANFDDDFDNIVYPKYVRVTSGTPVTSGYITEKE